MAEVRLTPSPMATRPRHPRQVPETPVVGRISEVWESEQMLRRMADRDDRRDQRTAEVRGVRDGYRTADTLNARSQIYRYNEDPYPWQCRVFDHLALPKRCRVLELGCGPGKLWLEKADRLPSGWAITLTDLSPGMLQEARRTLAGVGSRFEYALADAQAFPFPANCFDAVIANHMVYHVPNKPALFAAVRRVLRPGGRFYPRQRMTTSRREDPVRHSLIPGKVRRGCLARAPTVFLKPVLDAPRIAVR